MTASKLQNIEHQVLEKLPAKANEVQYKFSADNDIIFLNAEHATLFNEDRDKVHLQELSNVANCKVIIRVLGVKINKEGTASLVARLQQLLMIANDDDNVMCMFD